MAITRRQKAVLDYIKDFLAERGYSPTLEEIADHFQMASLNGVYKHLKNLEERGFIRRLSNQARSIELVDKPVTGESIVPLLGYVAAGRPIEAVANAEYLQIPQDFLTRGRNYVLRVQGDSMIEDHIADGDLVIVEERRHAHDGETVVALIDGEEATLKRYYREGRSIRLQPSNSAMEPIVVDESRLRIQGVVVGLMRKFK